MPRRLAERHLEAVAGPRLDPASRLEAGAGAVAGVVPAIPRCPAERRPAVPAKPPAPGSEDCWPVALGVAVAVAVAVALGVAIRLDWGDCFGAVDCSEAVDCLMGRLAFVRQPCRDRFRLYP